METAALKHAGYAMALSVFVVAIAHLHLGISGHGVPTDAGAATMLAGLGWAVFFLGFLIADLARDAATRRAVAREPHREDQLRRRHHSRATAVIALLALVTTRIAQNHLQHSLSPRMLALHVALFVLCVPLAILLADALSSRLDRIHRR
ncbi:hypothetical protein QLQ12_30840 [Actinoplanes sp. NEAU-A12]|uniref:Uncharacterized protein n=1 Tax=Actinoplanes sandaracinus TaxID=3045177 RepID=A0ABT6WTH2_9ACTN|nr:hypothetical protein [Actinoplanes sandaracinus]MDI6103020.1 hypothetical protein [Actinoplanes sandaracinus]